MNNNEYVQNECSCNTENGKKIIGDVGDGEKELFPNFTS